MCNRQRTTREQAYEALFNLVKTTPLPNNAKWSSSMRGIKGAEEVGPANQPALFVCQGAQRASKRRDTGAITWEWWAWLVVYFRTNVEPVDEDWAFANAVLEALEDTLFDFDGVQTLGGLVADTFIEGEIGLFAEPNIAQQQTLMIPVCMLIGE